MKGSIRSSIGISFGFGGSSCIWNCRESWLYRIIFLKVNDQYLQSRADFNADWTVRLMGGADTAETKSYHRLYYLIA